MKRHFIIRNIILVILVLIIVIVGGYYFIHKNARKYKVETVESYNYFILKHNKLVGVIDKEANKIIEPIYDDVKIPNPEKPVFICYNGDNTEVLNENKEQILSNYNKVEPIRLKNIASDLMYEKSVLTYSENGKYGLINLEGKKITKPIYDEIEGLQYKEGELLVKENGKLGVINIKGNKLINIEYDKIDVDGYYTDENKYKYAGYIVSNTTDEGYRYGYINYAGKTLLKTEYNELSRITSIIENENVYLLGAKNGQFGVTKNNDQILNNEYQSITYDESNKLLVIEKSKKYGISNLQGKIIVPTQYEQIDIIGVYLYAKNEQGVTVYNNNGTEANIDKNMSIINTNNEKYKIRINSENDTKYGVINKDGTQIIEEKYNYIEYLYNNYFIVSDENSKLGVIDDKEEIKIAIENDSIQKVGNTDIIQAVLTTENLTRLYSKDMNIICEMTDAKTEINGNIIKIYNSEETRYFNEEGNELQNADVYPNNNLLAKKENDKWGFVNREGKVVVDFKYDKVTEFNEYGYAAVEQNGKWGSINSKGQQVVDLIYELQENIVPSFIGQYYQVKFGFGEIYYTDEKNQAN